MVSDSGIGLQFFTHTGRRVRTIPEPLSAMAAQNGTLAYGSSVIKFLDVSSINELVPKEHELDGALDLAAIGGTVYVLDESYYSPGKGVAYFDQSLRVFGPTEAGMGLPILQSAITSNGQHVVLGGSALQVWDVNPPEAIVIVGELSSVVGSSLAMDGDVVYAVSGDSLFVVGIANPAAPQILGRTALASPVALAVGSGVVFAASGNLGLQLVDVSIPTAPALVGATGTHGYAADVAAEGTMAYVAVTGSNPELVVVNGSDTANPQVVGSVPTPAAGRSIALFGQTAYLACGASGVTAINVANPEQPEILAHSITGSGSVVAADSQAIYLGWRREFDDCGSSFSEGWLTMQPVQCLASQSPVEMSQLDAVSTATGIVLRWTMAIDEDVLYFRIIRAVEGEPPAQVGERRSEGVGHYEFVDSSVRRGVVYDYWIDAVGRGNEVTRFGPLHVSHNGAALPAPTMAITPNPSRESCTFTWFSGEACHTTLRIIDASGRSQCTLVDGVLEGGSHRVTWNWKDDARRPLATGVYFYHLQAGSLSHAGRLTHIR